MDTSEGRPEENSRSGLGCWTYEAQEREGFLGREKSMVRGLKVEESRA